MSAPHEEWLTRAENDLRFAELGLREGFYSQVCFLSQQVVEKCFKGMLVALGRSYPKSHSLRELASKLPELSLKKHSEALTILDGYYVPIRYPDAAPGMKAGGAPNKGEARVAIDTARAIWDIVTKYLSKKG
ncbi:MAG: HEPN domain-containing protein [bacterium]